MPSSVSKSTPGSRRVTPSKTLPTEIRTPNSKNQRKFGGAVPRISVDTVHRVLTAEIKCNFIIVDCRYQYEYSGGHIAGAVSCPPSEKLMLMDWLFSTEYGVTRSGPTILIMHCEFSQCRAPRLATDVFRQYIGLGVNTGLEVYVMKGGYCEFFRQFPEWCEPTGYVPMHDHRPFEHQHQDGAAFDVEAFVERNSMSSQKETKRRMHYDSPFFPSTCSPMDYSPAGVVADLARVFVEDGHDDSSNGGSSATRHTVTINTSEDDFGFDDELFADPSDDWSPSSSSSSS